MSERTRINRIYKKKLITTNKKKKRMKKQRANESVE